MRMMRAVKRASTKPAGNAESSSPDGRRPACEMRLGKLSSAAFKRFLVSIKSATKPSDEKKKRAATGTGNKSAKRVCYKVVGPNKQTSKKERRRSKKKTNKQIRNRFLSFFFPRPMGCRQRQTAIKNEPTEAFGNIKSIRKWPFRVVNSNAA